MSNMFTIKKDENWEKLKVALTKKFSEKINREIGIELIDGVNRIRNRIILSMRNTPKTGKTYTKKSVKHIASVPGKPPAIDQGDLVGRILVSNRLAQGEVEVGVGKTSKTGKDLKYAIMLEKGTKNMDARPFMEPAASIEIPIIQANISRAIFFKGIQDTLG